MPVSAANNTRAGGSQFLAFANTMCRLTNLAAPTMRVRWAGRPAFIAVLDAALLVCELLPAAMDEKIVMDAEDLPAFDPSDETVIPGQQS